MQDTIHYMSNLDTTMTTSPALHACKTITQKKKLSHAHTHTHTYTDLMEEEGDGGELKGTMEHKED